MVEMMNLKIHRFCILLAALLGVGTLGAQQLDVKARIAGLEKNETYMSLLREDARLQSREDSIVRVVERLRTQLREDPEGRQSYSREILDLENRIFEIRNAKGQLIDRINTIEQEWVLANLDSGAARGSATHGQLPEIPESQKVRNLVYNPWFAEELPAADYAALRRSQELEPVAVDFANRYFDNYTTLRQLADSYAAVQTEAEAQDIYERYGVLQRLNGALADSLAGTWNYIFDNKNYAYGYLLDKMGQKQILSRQEEALSKAQQQLAALRGETASDAVADYFLRKRVLVDYEQAVARVLGLDAAADSLRGVAAQVAEVDYRLPKIVVAERYFLQYDSVIFTRSPKYSYQNPIPECKVYEHGTIYRILLGTFNTKRAVSTFRGAYPLSYLVNDAGKWCYYTGGFATREEADSVQGVLKKHGFLRPEVVVWNDGVYRNLAEEADAPVSFRVEISGTDELSDAVRQAITEGAEGRELSRVGQQLFVVGTFDDRAVAERLVAALQQIDPALEIKVAETSE